MSKVMIVQSKKKRAPRRRRAAPRRIPMAVITGRGAYKKVNRKSSYAPYGSMIGSGIGSVIGGPVGGLIGGGVGHLAQGLIKHFTGFGDYTIETNSLMGQRFSPPELINHSHRGVCLRHREYIGDITASAAFTVTAYDLNPGLSTSFPWLSGVANNFEQYAILGMVFEFKTLSADYTTAASAALGYVAMATQYNSLLPVFTDKVHLENYEFANSAKPSESFVHPIECKRALTPAEPLYVRTGPVQDNADQRLYDLGKFQIATGGNSGSGVLGELWCTYEVALFKPRLVDAEDINLVAHWQLSSVTATNTLGADEPTADTGNTLDGTFTTQSITFPATLTTGIYEISWAVKGGSATVIPPTWTATSGCTILSRWFGDTVTVQQTPSGVASTTLMACFFLQITAASAQLTCNGGGTFPTSITGGDLWVAQLNSEM